MKLFFMVFVLSFTLIDLTGLLLTPNNRIIHAEADDIQSVGRARTAEVIFGFIEICTSGGKIGKTYIKQSFSEGDLNSGKIFDSSDNTKMDTSHLWDGAGGNQSCAQGFSRAITELYGSPLDFVRQYYEKEGGTWYIKEEYQSDRNFGLYNQATTEMRRRAREKGWYFATGGSLEPRETLGYRAHALKRPFDSCFKRDSDETDSSISFTLNGIKFALERGGGDTVRVGAIIDRSSDIGGRFNGDRDGRWSCSEFLRNIKSNPNYFRHLSADREDINEEINEELRERALQERIAEIEEILDNNQQQVNNCFTIAGKDPILNSLLAPWLVANDGQNPPTSLSGAGLGGITLLTPEEGEAIRSCLFQQIEGLEDKIAAPLDVTEVDDVEAGSDDEDEETCESHGGPFGWILCGIFNGIMKALDTFAGFVQDRLDVEIQDQDAVRGAWDSIRVIANVVFVMAFLVIIISQTIVGRF